MHLLPPLCYHIVSQVAPHSPQSSARRKYTATRTCPQIRCFTHVRAPQCPLHAPLASPGARLLWLLQGLDWEKAWAVFAAMRRAGVEPSIVSYNALMSACERCGQVDRCACEMAAWVQGRHGMGGLVVGVRLGGCIGRVHLLVRPALEGRVQAAGAGAVAGAGPG